MTSRNSDDEIRKLERLARDGDIDALERWLEWAIRMQDRETIRTIDAIVYHFAGGSNPKPGQNTEALKRISRRSAEIRHGLPRGSLVEHVPPEYRRPDSSPNAEVRRVGDGRERAECRECGWVGPVRSSGTNAVSEARGHRCASRGDRDPLRGGGGVHHSCGGRTRRSELSSTKIASGLWGIACSACGDRWEYDNAEVESNPRRNSDEEVRRLEREASAGLTPGVVSRLARAYARAGMIQSNDVWVVEHQRLRSIGRSRGERGLDRGRPRGRPQVGRDQTVGERVQTPRPARTSASTSVGHRSLIPARDATGGDCAARGPSIQHPRRTRHGGCSRPFVNGATTRGHRPAHQTRRVRALTNRKGS